MRRQPVAKAPRVSLADIEGAIVKRHFITGNEAADVPLEVASNGDRRGLGLLTIRILEMKNDFIVIGKSALASPENLTLISGASSPTRTPYANFGP
jgi:hypothetical protein